MPGRESRTFNPWQEVPPRRPRGGGGDGSFEVVRGVLHSILGIVIISHCWKKRFGRIVFSKSSFICIGRSTVGAQGVSIIFNLHWLFS